MNRVPNTIRKRPNPPPDIISIYAPPREQTNPQPPIDIQRTQKPIGLSTFLNNPREIIVNAIPAGIPKRKVIISSGDNSNSNSFPPTVHYLYMIITIKIYTITLKNLWFCRPFHKPFTRPNRLTVIAELS
jgi:hypothetical protein